MSNVTATITRYEDTCKAGGRKPLPFIMKVLNKEKEVSLSWKLSGQTKVDMHLYLAGNNRLVTDTRLNDDDVDLLCTTLSNNLYVVSMDLRYNNITDIGAQYIARLIQDTATLKEINLMCNDIGEEGAQHIAQALHKNDTIVSLGMNGNKMGNRGGMYFAQMLQINITLEGLDLADTDQKTESVIALATVLQQNSSLKALNMSRPLLFSQQEETTVHYANMLKVNKGIKELHLAKHDMHDFGATRLAESLSDNWTLTYLDLSCNRITRDGARELAKMLKNDTMLKVLDLSYNRLEDDGALYLAEALSTYNTNLTTLVVTSNNIAGKGLCGLADCMKMNSSLSNIYIWGNKLEESACIAFASLLDTGRLELKNTDVKPYVVDGTTNLSELSHGVKRWYYWAPSYGEQANNNLAQFTAPTLAVK